MEAARSAIDNPLLDDISLKGAKGVLINITGGYDMTLFELDEAANEIRRQVDDDANIILGSTFEPELEGRIRVSVVAAGLEDVETAELVPAPAETVAAVETPSIVTKIAPVPTTPVEPQPDTRPDFRGRDLPAAHMPRQEGAETVSADAALGKRPSPSDDSPAGFSNLFGWRRDAVEQADNEVTPEPIISSPDDHPKPAAFDDADLEIPAFLRRSANT
jgi:cell division protein FtsZ